MAGPLCCAGLDSGKRGPFWRGGNWGDAPSSWCLASKLHMSLSSLLQTSHARSGGHRGTAGCPIGQAPRPLQQPSCTSRAAIQREILSVRLVGSGDDLERRGELPQLGVLEPAGEVLAYATQMGGGCAPKPLAAAI